MPRAPKVDSRVETFYVISIFENLLNLFKLNVLDT